MIVDQANRNRQAEDEARRMARVAAAQIKDKEDRERTFEQIAKSAGKGSKA